jgi:hypothetical protein
MQAALQRKSYLCIPSLGIAGPQSQFPHSCVCVCERFIYFQDRSTNFLQQKQINRSQTYESGNWDCSRASPFLGLFVSNFRYWFFAVRDIYQPRTRHISTHIFYYRTSCHVTRDEVQHASCTAETYISRGQKIFQITFY